MASPGLSLDSIAGEVKLWMDHHGFQFYSAVLLGYNLTGSMLQALSTTFCMKVLGMESMGRALHFCNLVEEALHCRESDLFAVIKVWGVEEVLHWLQDADLEDLLGVFRLAQVDGRALLQISSGYFMGMCFCNWI